jgi:hypothetical protein
MKKTAALAFSFALVVPSLLAQQPSKTPDPNVTLTKVTVLLDTRPDAGNAPATAKVRLKHGNEVFAEGVATVPVGYTEVTLPLLKKVTTPDLAHVTIDILPEPTPARERWTFTCQVVYHFSDGNNLSVMWALPVTLVGHESFSHDVGLEQTFKSKLVRGE